MEKITYFLGAGASANVLPLIKEDPLNRRPGLASAMSDFILENKGLIQQASKWEEPQFTELSRIVDKCKRFGTPDLLAKHFLERSNHDHYRMLKLLMSAYFHVKQLPPDKTGQGFEGQILDPRVVYFLTTISQRGKLPPNVRILSYNYDSQIEMGAKQLHPVGTTINDFNTNFHVWPFQANDTDRADPDYFLLHLNGTCGSLYSDRHLSIGNPFLYDFSRPVETLLSFAWEDDENFGKPTFTNRRLELAKKMIEGTTILVSIGYSFPFFNRKIDAQLFELMKPTLRKIYFQDPKSDGKFLHGQFGLLRNNVELMENPNGKVVEIVPINDVSQYHVPFEL